MINYFYSSNFNTESYYKFPQASNSTIPHVEIAYEAKTFASEFQVFKLQSCQPEKLKCVRKLEKCGKTVEFFENVEN